MNANPGKCYLLLSTKIAGVVSIDRIQITSRTAETRLGMTIDFENHLSAICNKVSRKINANCQLYVPRKTPYCCDKNIC